MAAFIHTAVEWLRYGFFYFRVLLIAVLALLCRLVGLFSASLRVSAETAVIRLGNRMFTKQVPIEPFLDREKFYAFLDVADFRTLCRRMGKADNWFEGRVVLDAGCGHGNLTRYLGSRGAARVTGLDIASQSVAFANAKLEADPIPNVSFVEGSVYELPFADNSFDVITSQVVFEHLFEIPKALSELFRVLKPGGEFYFTIDSFRCRYGAHLPHFVHIPWPALFFSETALEKSWRAGLQRVAEENPGIEIPDFFAFEWSLPSLNRITMAELENMINASGFAVAASTEFADEKPLRTLFPWLKRFPRIYEYIRGSKAFVLRKPDPDA